MKQLKRNLEANVLLRNKNHTKNIRLNKILNIFLMLITCQTKNSINTRGKNGRRLREKNKHQDRKSRKLKSLKNSKGTN